MPYLVFIGQRSHRERLAHLTRQDQSHPRYDPLSSHTPTHGAMQQITQHIVATYRGVELGWVPVGRPRNQSETERLLSLVNRIRPDYVNKVKTFSTF